MNVVKKLIWLSISLIIVGCGTAMSFISTGVSLGGTGDPGIERNLPPIITEAFLKTSSKKYTLWSKEKIDPQCAVEKPSLQLIDPFAFKKIDIDYLNRLNIENNRSLGVITGIQNKTNFALYNFFKEC